VNINGRHTKLKIWHKNSFLMNISEKLSIKNWVDVEEEYYIALNECLKNKSEDGIQQLNTEFLYIQVALKEYLEMEILYGFSKSPEIEKKIYTLISQEEIKKAGNLDNLLFLNFNYTNTESLYISEKNPHIVIHIHGELETPKNPIIFGYGDEIDDKYKLIEQENDNRYLENIKSIKYLETDNYKKLLTFINSDKYQIFIMGHSCGISDRTLLNTLFEHENCVNIKFFIIREMMVQITIVIL
jgi:hypothetical protein